MVDDRDQQNGVSTADSGATSKDTSNNSISGPKAIIKSVDMREELQQESVDSALEKYNIEKDRHIFVASEQFFHPMPSHSFCR